MVDCQTAHTRQGRERHHAGLMRQEELTQTETEKRHSYRLLGVAMNDTPELRLIVLHTRASFVHARLSPVGVTKAITTLVV